MAPRRAAVWALVGLFVGLPRGALAQTPAPAVVSRPMVQRAGGLAVLAASSVAASRVGGGRGIAGVGLHLALTVGLGRGFEVDGGLGLRDPSDGARLAADRYARIDREDVYQVGNRTLGNPYLRARFALLDRPDVPVHVGLDALLVAPLAEQTALSLGVGAPVHLVLGARVRVESGLFLQVIPSDSSFLRNVVNVPLRVNVRLGAVVTLGLVTGLVAANVGRDTAEPVRIPLGLQGYLRVQPRTDVVFQVLYPALEPFGTDAMGFGVGILARR
ncbi:MAG: hypothetical protein HY909_19070 [Deltaproteobacteria bacterium]|nr:hypothetical protein [Deltaproteobacteria bacterium]